MDECFRTIINHELLSRMGSGSLAFVADPRSNATFDGVARLIPAAIQSLTRHWPATEPGKQAARPL